MRHVAAIDLFCGAGGLTYGLEQAGLTVLEGVDVDTDCQFPYEANTLSRFVHCDVRNYSAERAGTTWGSTQVRVLVGCAPCQPFSTYTQGPKGTHRAKWSMLDRFSELIRQTAPEIVSMENVTPLQRTTRFEAFVRGLIDENYDVSHQIVECQKYGAPQMRRRLVLLASKFGPIELVPETHASPESWIDVNSAIGRMPKVSAGEIDDFDPLHRASALSETNLRRIRASKPGGSWRDWPSDLVADCHVRASGRKYPAVYGRMEWDKPAPTITGQSFGFGSGRFGHPEQDRALTLREAAILQTFPKSYAFVTPDGPVRMKSIGRMIGNAVPPLLGKVIGESILRHLEAFER